MEIKIADINDVDGITLAHMNCLTEELSDFTPLGEKIVRQFYKNSITRDLGTVIVIKDVLGLAGFVMITKDVNILFNKALLGTFRDNLYFIFNANTLSLLKAAIKKITSHTINIPNIPELVYLAVNEQSRGNGYGRLLIDAAENCFRQKNISYYELNVHASNKSAFSLYQSKGFLIKREYFKDGAKMYTLYRKL